MVVGLRVAAALVRLEVEDMALNHAGIPLDFDFPAFLAEKGGLIPVLREKQPHFIAGVAVGGAGAQDGKPQRECCVLSAHGPKYPS